MRSISASWKTFLLGVLWVVGSTACGCKSIPRAVYSPTEASELLGAYEFWAPTEADIDAALAAVDGAILDDKRLKPDGTGRYALAIVGRVDDGVRMLCIYGEKNWEKDGVPSPAVIKTGCAPTYLQALYDTQKRIVTLLTAPQRLENGGQDHPPRKGHASDGIADRIEGRD